MKILGALYRPQRIDFGGLRNPVTWWRTATPASAATGSWPGAKAMAWRSCPAWPATRGDIDFGGLNVTSRPKRCVILPLGSRSSRRPRPEPRPRDGGTAARAVLSANVAGCPGPAAPARPGAPARPRRGAGPGRPGAGNRDSDGGPSARPTAGAPPASPDGPRRPAGGTPGAPPGERDGNGCREPPCADRRTCGMGTSAENHRCRSGPACARTRTTGKRPLSGGNDGIQRGMALPAAQDFPTLFCSACPDGWTAGFRTDSGAVRQA